MKFGIFFGIGVLAGSMITIQSVLNSALGKKIEILGSVLTATVVSLFILIISIFVFPGSANFKRIPGADEWYLYMGGILGIAILAAPIFLIPKIGATSTLTAIVVGQLLLALILDHYGLFDFPRIQISPTRIVGMLLLGVGAYLIKK